MLLWSCATKDQSPETATDTASTGVIVNEIIHDTLSARQMQQIRRIQAVFAEVEPVSYEETVNDFKRDQHPDREIEIWLAMADAYEQVMSQHPTFDLAHKQEVFKLLLIRSSDTEAETRAKFESPLLSADEIIEVLNAYKLEAKPLLFIKEKEHDHHEYGK
jgi:hypothetical protein